MGHSPEEQALVDVEAFVELRASRVHKDLLLERLTDLETVLAL